MGSHLNRLVARSLVLVPVLLAFVSLPAAAGDLPESPDGTVKAVFEALADKHPEIIWQALPASYQRDITELTHAFAGKMDPQLWDAIFGIGRKAAGVLRDKKEYFLNSSLMNAAGEEKERIAGNWDTAVAAMDSFFSSEISQLDSLTTMDWGRFLSTTGVEIMDRVAAISPKESAAETEEDIVAKLRATKVETVLRDGDVAMLRISAPDEDPEEVSLTRVEGRWVPSDMAEEWDSKMAEGKKQVESISEEQMAQAKTQAMMTFGMVNAVLDQLAAANSQEEFEQVMAGALGPFMGMAGGMAGPTEDYDSDSGG